MQWLVAMVAALAVLLHVRLRVNLSPIGEEVRVEERPVDPVAVVGDGVNGAGGHPDHGLATRPHRAPSAGHRDQVTPRVQSVTIPKEVPG